MGFFKRKNNHWQSGYKKYEPKQYEPYGWVKENLKFGFVLIIIVSFIYGIIQLYNYLF